MSSSNNCGHLVQGKYITDAQECAFIDAVITETDKFLEKSTIESRVLVLPYFEPRYRFILHNVIADHFGDRLKTLSVGEGIQRQTFLYSHNLMEDKKPGKKNTMISEQEGLDVVIHETSSQVKVKRPSKKLYQPPQAAAADKKSKDFSSGLPAVKICSNAASSSNSNPDEVGEDWDSLYDDSGECLKPDLVQDFKKVMNISEDCDNTEFETPSKDFNDFCENLSAPLTDHEFGHVLEIYDFPADLKSHDLFSRIAAIGSNTFEIVWVDDTHALAVFESEKESSNALRHKFLDVKVRVLSQGTKESRLKARRSTDRLLPFKKRPQTSTEAARRLVGRHLGLKVHVSKEQIQAEKKALQDAKEQRRQTKKQTNDIWNGNVD